MTLFLRQRTDTHRERTCWCCCFLPSFRACLRVNVNFTVSRQHFFFHLSSSLFSSLHFPPSVGQLGLPFSLELGWSQRQKVSALPFGPALSPLQPPSFSMIIWLPQSIRELQLTAAAKPVMAAAPLPITLSDRGRPRHVTKGELWEVWPTDSTILTST